MIIYDYEKTNLAPGLYIVEIPQTSRLGEYKETIIGEYSGGVDGHWSWLGSDYDHLKYDNKRNIFNVLHIIDIKTLKISKIVQESTGKWD